MQYYGDTIIKQNIIVHCLQTSSLSPADKTIRKLIDNEFDYKACLIWTAVGVIAVFSLVHLGKVFFARSEKDSEKYRLSQQVGLLTTIETTLSMPPKYPAASYTNNNNRSSSSTLAAATPTTSAWAPATPLTPMVPPLTPSSPASPLPLCHAPAGVLKASSGDKRPQQQQRQHQHNVYFAPQDNAPRVMMMNGGLNNNDDSRRSDGVGGDGVDDDRNGGGSLGGHHSPPASV